MDNELDLLRQLMIGELETLNYLEEIDSLKSESVSFYLNGYINCLRKKHHEH